MADGKKKKAVISFVFSVLPAVSLLAAAFGCPLPDLSWLGGALGGAGILGAATLAKSEKI